MIVPHLHIFREVHHDSVGWRGGGGVFNPSSPGVNKERKMLFWYLSLWMESHDVTI